MAAIGLVVLVVDVFARVRGAALTCVRAAVIAASLAGCSVGFWSGWRCVSAARGRERFEFRDRRDELVRPWPAVLEVQLGAAS
jgi:phosphate/sulfate permease